MLLFFYVPFYVRHVAVNHVALFNVAAISCCTLFILHFSHIAHFLRVVTLSCCNISLFRFSHAGTLSCWTSTSYAHFTFFLFLLFQIALFHFALLTVVLFLHWILSCSRHFMWQFFQVPHLHVATLFHDVFFLLLLLLWFFVFLCCFFRCCTFVFLYSPKESKNQASSDRKIKKLNE